MITDPNPGIHMKIIPMWEVLNGGSCDATAYVRDWENPEYPDVAEVLDHKIQDDGYPDLLESIKTWGLKEGFEPCWDGYEIVEGHHRIAALIELGAEWCPVIPNRKEYEAFTAPDGSTPAMCAHCVDCDRDDEEWGW